MSAKMEILTVLPNASGIEGIIEYAWQIERRRQGEVFCTYAWTTSCPRFHASLWTCFECRIKAWTSCTYTALPRGWRPGVLTVQTALMKCSFADGAVLRAKPPALAAAARLTAPEALEFGLRALFTTTSFSEAARLTGLDRRLISDISRAVAPIITPPHLDGTVRSAAVDGFHPGSHTLTTIGSPSRQGLIDIVEGSPSDTVEPWIERHQPRFHVVITDGEDGLHCALTRAGQTRGLDPRHLLRNCIQGTHKAYDQIKDQIAWQMWPFTDARIADVKHYLSAYWCGRRVRRDVLRWLFAQSPLLELAYFTQETFRCLLVYPTADMRLEAADLWRRTLSDQVRKFYLELAIEVTERRRSEFAVSVGVGKSTGYLEISHRQYRIRWRGARGQADLEVVKTWALGRYGLHRVARLAEVARRLPELLINYLALKTSEGGIDGR